MEEKSFFKKQPKFISILNICVLVVLVVFGFVVCMQYIRLHPPIAFMLAVVGATVVLIVLCVVGIYGAKTLKGKIVIYVLYFLLLLLICCFTGSTNLAAMYCVILTQIYLNVEDFKTKFIIFAASCAGFAATVAVGWFINYSGQGVGYDEVITIVTGALTGVSIIAIHFLVASFLIKFYNTNLKLTAALKEADERKNELEKVYKELSETAVFQERNRIAREIHDNAGHSMTAVIMQTEAAKLLIDTDPEQAKSKIISANMQARAALEQMRESVHLLAGRSTTQSLKSEMQEILAQTMDGTGVNVRADIADIEVVGEKRRFLTSCLKESLTNGMRHGGATAFYVELAEKDGYICLTVSDNGSGLPPDFKEGYGIKGMREKATAFGGLLVLESEEGDGCEIKITVRTFS